MESVSRVFQMGEVLVEALKHVTLTIPQGEFLAFVGPSGSGKTTILNLIGGMDSPSSGRLWYRDQELTSANGRTLTQYRRNEIGFVFQFYNLVPNLTAHENVMVATEISDHPRDVDEVLSRVGLADDDRHDCRANVNAFGERSRRVPPENNVRRLG